MSETSDGRSGSYETSGKGLGEISFPPKAEPTLSNYLEQSASCVETLEKNLYRLKQLAVKLAGDTPDPKQDLPEVESNPTTFIDRARQLHHDLKELDRDLSAAITRIESALG